MTTRLRFTMARASAVTDDDSRRHCAMCGDFIDPIDWCHVCRTLESVACKTHGRLRKRSDAAFCGNECRREHRASYERDCLR